MQRPDRDRESGYTLVGLMVVVAVINVALAVAVMSTRTLGRRAREAELLWRGQQIANAIGCYEQANGGEPLARLEQLVDANCLRRVFRDPMASDGEWRVLRQQDVADGTVAALLGVEVGGDSLTAAGGSAVGAASLSSAAGRSGTPPGGAGGFGSGSLTLGQQRPAVTAGSGAAGSAAARLPGRSSLRPAGSRGVGDNAIVGVVSSSTEESLRVYGDKTNYGQWVFLGGQAAATGATTAPGAAFPGGRGPTAPGQGLTPRR